MEMASRSPSSSGEGLNKGAWTEMEDNILKDYIKANGVGKWSSIPKKAGLNRCGKSCRLRWLNYLRPDIKRGNISEDEEELIIRLHKLLGNRWSLIAGRLPGRTDNEIKNYWNTIAGKKILGQASSRQALSKFRKPRQRRSCMNGTTDKKEAEASIAHCRNSIDSKEQGSDERLKPELITPRTQWTVDKDCTFEDFELDDRFLMDFLGLNDNTNEHKGDTNGSVQHMAWDTRKVSQAVPSLNSDDALILSRDYTFGGSDIQTPIAPLLGEGELDQLLYMNTTQFHSNIYDNENHL